MTNETTAVAQAEASERKLSEKDLRSIFWRSCILDCPWTYERQQNMGYSYAMVPAIDKLYEKGSEKQKRAYGRSLDFMAVTPQLSTLLMGINAALEERNATDPDFDDSTIAAVKTSLMGPLAGVGDSLIASTLRIIATSIALGFSQQGSILGPILMLLVFNIPGFALRWWGVHAGYKYGSDIINDAASGGIMEKITYAASIVGLMAIGGMIASFIWFDSSLIVIGSGEYATSLLEYLEMIMPCLPQLLVFGIMYWIMGKNVKTTWVLLGTIVLSIAAFGIVSLF